MRSTELIEKLEELYEWLETECQSPETADLSHSFAENLMIRLAKISYIKINALKAETEPELCPICKTTYLSDRVCLTCTKELCSPLNSELKAEQSQEPVKSAEEILDNYSNYATMRGRSCFAIEYTDAVKAMEEYHNQKKNK